LRFVAAPDGAPAFRCECGALVRFVGLEAVEILEMLSHGTPA
jgi:hypothetical protein